MSTAVRWALPEGIIAVTTVLLTLAAMLLNSWLLALPTTIMAALFTGQLRRYLKAAPAAYLYEGASYSQINSTLTETVESDRPPPGTPAPGGGIGDPGTSHLPGRPAR